MRGLSSSTGVGSWFRHTGPANRMRCCSSEMSIFVFYFMHEMECDASVRTQASKFCGQLLIMLMQAITIVVSFERALALDV